MVTSTQVSNYLANVYLAQSVYMDRLSLKEKMGHGDLTEKRVVGTLLDMYVQIMTDYFADATYPGGYFDTTNNFFDVSETKDIMLRINIICDTDNYLDL